MADVLMIQGKAETIFDEEDFARMLYEKLGSDAEHYFREASDPDSLMDALMDEVEDDPLKFCTGECTKTYEIQEHYEKVLEDIEEDLRALYKIYINKKKPPVTEIAIINRLIKKVCKAK